MDKHFVSLKVAAIIGGVVLLALAGIALLTYAIYHLLPDTNTPTPTRQATKLPPIVIPTIVALPSPTMTPLPTETPPEVTASPTPPTRELTISAPANVRSGPGQNYPILGGLSQGTVVPLLGCDASRTWFVIAYPAAANGQGWVSNLVARYAGDVNGLEIIAAPPPPPTTAPSATPLPSPTTAPPTTAPTAAPGAYLSNGIRGEAFWVENTRAAVGQDIWFNFKVVNTTDNVVNYSVLAAHCDAGPNAQSWTNEKLKAHQTLEWRDHINISTPGTYKLYLGICYGGKEACLANAAPWDRLSADVTVTVE